MLRLDNMYVYVAANSTARKWVWYLLVHVTNPSQDFFFPSLTLIKWNARYSVKRVVAVSPITLFTINYGVFRSRYYISVSPIPYVIDQT